MAFVKYCAIYKHVDGRTSSLYPIQLALSLELEFTNFRGDPFWYQSEVQDILWMVESAVRHGIFDVAETLRRATSLGWTPRQRLRLFTSALNGIINRLCPVNGKARYFRLERRYPAPSYILSRRQERNLSRSRARARAPKLPLCSARVLRTL